MIEQVLLMGLCTVFALCITLGRVVPLRYILGYASVIDVGFSALLLLFFMGTFKGAMMATVAGLMLAVFLTVGRKLFGYSRVRVHRAGLKFTFEEQRTEAEWIRFAELGVKWVERLYTALKAVQFHWPIKPHPDWQMHHRGMKTT